MHPNPAFRHDDRGLLEALLDQVGFGMVFAATPDGPRVAHVPLLSTGDGAVQFHLARGNALTRHLDGATVLAVINGPDGYVSPRWYEDADGLLGQITALSDKHEARVSAGEAWTIDKMSPTKLRAMLAGIVGFELEVLAWRETLKLSQNKTADERARVASGLENEGSRAIAQLMRTLGGEA